VPRKSTRRRYTPGRLKTKGRFDVQYGKIEGRIQIPGGQGIWPAFWALGRAISAPGSGWPQCGETDNYGEHRQRAHDHPWRRA
jgi:beta-glucanase (GH16 family)